MIWAFLQLKFFVKYFHKTHKIVNAVEKIHKKLSIKKKSIVLEHLNDLSIQNEPKK